MKSDKVSKREYAITKFMLNEHFKASEIKKVSGRSGRVLGFMKKSKDYEDFVKISREYNKKL